LLHYASNTIALFIETICIESTLAKGLYNNRRNTCSLTKDNFTIRKILVAVDGSKAALNAGNQAIDLAKKHQAELTALYVIPSDIRYDYLEDVDTARLPGPLKGTVMSAMEGGQKYVDAVKQKASETNISVRTDVAISSTSVVKTIVEYAEGKKMDLIVIGSKGMSGIKRMLLGSIASGVVTYAHCPILVVK
jgi:nucleotide-binding universal stress UspA family protein